MRDGGSSTRLEKDRELRYQTASEIKTDLKRVKRDRDSRAGQRRRKRLRGVEHTAAPASDKIGCRAVFENSVRARR